MPSANRIEIIKPAPLGLSAVQPAFHRAFSLLAASIREGRLSSGLANARERERERERERYKEKIDSLRPTAIVPSSATRPANYSRL
jgi:hypothetical protein